MVSRQQLEPPTPAPCPCGCGRHMPAELDPALDVVAAAIEAWIEAQGLTLAALKSADRTTRMVEARRRVTLYLRAHGWSLPQIGRFIDRDHTTVLYYLEGRPAA